MFMAAAVVFAYSAAGSFAAEGDAVASVGDKQFTTLQAAIDEANGGTVVLLSDVTENVTIAENSSVTIDLAGKTITNKDAEYTITNKGTLTLKGNGTVDNISHGKGAIVNNGTVNMEGGTLTRSKEASTSASDHGGNSWYVVDNNGGTFNMKAGTIKGTSYYSSLIRNLGATFNMTGGNLESNFIVLKNDDNGVINMTGGTISTKAEGGSAIQNWGELTMTGGTLNAVEGAAALYALAWDEEFKPPVAYISENAQINGNVRINIDDEHSDGKAIPVVNINGGNVAGDFSVGNGGQLAINGGSIEGIIAKAVNSSGNKIEISGGVFKVRPDDEFITADVVAKYNDSYILGTENDVKEAVAGAASGDTIEILKGDVALDADNGVTVKNSGDGNVTVNGETVAKGNSVTVSDEETPGGDNQQGGNGTDSDKNNQTAETTGTDKNEATPETGDNPAILGCIILMLTSVALGGTLIAGRRRG